MAGEDIIMVKQGELKRLHIIQKVLDKKLKQIEAVDIIDLTERQIRRIVKRVRKEGDAGIIHKLRGKPSNRALPQKLKHKVINLYRQKYPDFGPTLANEKLFEIDKINIGTQTLRNWLIEEGEWKVTHKRRKYKQWRERKHHFGQMIQVDGSHHDWLEGRGPELVFMGYIDDATGIVFGRFYEYEGTIPAMDSLKRYIKKYGMPHSIYMDKHTTYKSTAKPSIEDELNNIEPLSEFQRAAKDLGIEIIHANSPQAKGRIERLFKTFQDRFIKEMRLKGINSIKGANRFLSQYLPIYNRRFRIKATKAGDFHRSLPQSIDLDKVLCIKTERALRNDFTIVHNRKLYQILDQINAKRVRVEERVNNKMCIMHNDNSLKYKEISQRPKQQATYRVRTKRSYAPSMEHPFKRRMYEARLKREEAAQEQREPLLTKT